MASLSLLLLGAALIHAAQPLPAARGVGGGRGLDMTVGGVRRQRRDLHNVLPYEDPIMSYQASQRGGGANDLYYQSDDWRGRGLDQALQRLVERDQRRELEEERAAYLAALLRLLSEAESAGLVSPGDVEVVEEEQEEDDQGLPVDFQGPAPADYDETGQGMSIGRPPAAWWGLLEPQLAQVLLDRMEPRLAHSLLDKNRLGRVQPTGRAASGQREDALRHLVARILSNIGPNDLPMMSSGRQAAQAVSSAHRRTRRSLDDVVPPSPSNEPPLLRVKRLEEEEEKLRPSTAGLQRMKRIDTMATAGMEELYHESHRRQRRGLKYDPEILIDQILEYMKE